MFYTFLHFFLNPYLDFQNSWIFKNLRFYNFAGALLKGWKVSHFLSNKVILSNFQMSHMYSGASFISHTMIKSGEEAKKKSKKKEKKKKSKMQQSQSQQNKNYATSKSKSYFSFWTKKK